MQTDAGYGIHLFGGRAIQNKRLLVKYTEIMMFLMLGTAEKTKSEKERKRTCILKDTVVTYHP